ncbi:class D beta-lactamase [Arcticibacterium luteifluviistationis]|uniref:Beta-lactamase n=1 Tax=Arcticibacterium luteifluviistationis TaxID=1784714 RepID=A0A2Z4GDZ8_9BACT|nr:class D beta-lactamase [Arcticibacterium luteifluviistationis]AWV99476.1 class D beta-lactamase [Arcticibacterium luteifluviistationis]
MKNIAFLLAIASLITACSTSTKESTEEKEVVNADFQSIIDSSLIKGSILIFDANKSTYYSNDFKWAKKGFIPASTFKIANSINALENEIVENDSSMFYWDGEPKFLKSWEQDMNFYQAYQRSCVPCYQEIARKTGADKMHATLDKIGYPGMIFDSTNVDDFWLEGDSKISQYEQIIFLRRLANKELPISEHSYDIMNKIMVLKETENYTLYGKTGWAVQNENNIGWFVGFAKTKGNTYFLATNVAPTEALNIDDFVRLRMEVCLKALEGLISNASEK